MRFVLVIEDDEWIILDSITKPPSTIRDMAEACDALNRLAGKNADRKANPDKQ